MKDIHYLPRIEPYSPDLLSVPIMKELASYASWLKDATGYSFTEFSDEYDVVAVGDVLKQVCPDGPGSIDYMPEAAYKWFKTTKFLECVGEEMRKRRYYNDSVLDERKRREEVADTLKIGFDYNAETFKPNKEDSLDYYRNQSTSGFGMQSLWDKGY